MEGNNSIRWNTLFEIEIACQELVYNVGSIIQFLLDKRVSMSEKKKHQQVFLSIFYNGEFDPGSE